MRSTSGAEADFHNASVTTNVPLLVYHLARERLKEVTNDDVQI
jgi:hypothetical protein